MATTSPDNIWSPDSGDDYALTVDLAAMADTVQDALTSVRGSAAYRADLTNAQRLALTGGSLFEGLRVRTTDTKVDWLYTGGAWVAWGTATANVTTLSSGWTTTAGYPLRVVRNGGLVSIFGAVTNSGGALTTGLVTVPAGFAPSANTFLSAVHSNQAMNGTALINTSGLITFPTGYFDGALLSGGVVPLAGSWTI